MFKHNYLKVGVAVPKVKLGNCMENAIEMVNIANNAKDASIILFPELAISGYSLGDWHFNTEKIKTEKKALEYLVNQSNEQVWLIGGVLEYANSLFNCVYVLQNGSILGIVPKAYLPTSKEFAEPRMFASGKPFLEKPRKIKVLGKETTFGGCLFCNTAYDVCFGVEVCADVWTVLSPSENLYIQGAQMVFNASASTYHLGKNQKRLTLVASSSLKGSGAYIYTSCGITETASDVVFTGHKIVAVEDKVLLNEEKISFESSCSLVDIDIDSIKFSRISTGYYHEYAVNKLPTIEFALQESENFYFSNKIDESPFVPKKNEDYEEIIDVITSALYHRLKYIGIEKVVVGISGGLDSTLALLMCAECFKKYQLPLNNVLAYTMPGLGTGSNSERIAITLMNALNVHSSVIPIGEEVLDHFKLIDHDEKKKDTTYENAQARYRTFILMNVANQEKGLVIGTGDMSEIALGWSTFNGDQMSMYNVNSGLPKTTVRALVGYFSKKYANLSIVLNEVVNATISPELTSSSQSTEDIIGKYEINDFMLYHFLVHGASKDRLIFLIQETFHLNEADATHYYEFFMHRFNTNQYKRLASPEGVKIFSVSLSPHGDFRYPGDMK